MSAFEVLSDTAEGTPPPSPKCRSKLAARRAGGGGGGGRSGSGVSSGGSSSGSSPSGRTGSSSSSSGRSSSSFAGGNSFGGARYPSSSTADGVGRFSIPASAGTFSDRSAGGATREQIYGSGRYGSGYSAGYGTSRGSIYGGGVGGLRFPFMYYPILFGGGYAGYYGSDRFRNDTDRPGGSKTEYTLVVPSGLDQSLDSSALYGRVS